jgi:hypothetical protein
MYWHRPLLYSPNNFFRNPENVFGNIVSWNMLCAHRDNPVKIEGLEQVQP